MLRKLIVFAVTSGLAKKAYDHYRERKAAIAPTAAAEGSPEAGEARQASGRKPRTSKAGTGAKRRTAKTSSSKPLAG